MADNTENNGSSDTHQRLFAPRPEKSPLTTLFSFDTTLNSTNTNTSASTNNTRPYASAQNSPPPRDGFSGVASAAPMVPVYESAEGGSVACGDGATDRPSSTAFVNQSQATNLNNHALQQGQLFMTYRPPPPPPLLDRPLQLFNNLNDFQLLRTLGTGTFGRVRLAKYKDADKFFAMKIMKKVDVIKYKQERHVMNERWLLSKLNFPFIIRLYGAFQDAKNLYLLLEYAIGGELYSYLRRAGRFSLPTTKFYASEIMMTIEYLHSMNIAYRDLKPENLLLDGKGHVKVSDFGFAKHVPDRTWTLCGTPEYLAPEIIANKGHGKAVDWWALGVLIYEMLAGYPPYYDQTPFKTYEKILAGNLHFPAHFDPISVDLIQRLLHPDPIKRLGNLQGGAQDIRRHPWFAGVDWNGLFRRTIMAPIQPRVTHSGDCGNFDRYPEESSDFGSSGASATEDPFKSF